MSEDILQSDTAWRLLLVEDNPADLEYFLESVEDCAVDGFTFTTRPRLDQALEVLETDTFDVIVLDLSLPDSNGLGTLDKLQAAAPDAAMVVLSGVDDESIALDALKCGAQDYIIKGQLPPPLIQRALRYALERKRNECALREKNDQLEKMLRIDPLTGLLSRRYGLGILADEMERWRRYKHAFSLLMIDLDDFKRINDDFSHAAGDEALQSTAKYLTENLRATDKIIRYGGDEFLVILPDTDRDQLDEVCRKLQHSRLRCQLSESTCSELSLSIGGVVASGTLTSTGLIDEADLAMLIAKKSGKARYHIAEASDGQLDQHDTLNELRVARNSMRRILSRIISTLLAQIDREGDVLACRQDLMLALGEQLAQQLRMPHSEWQTLYNAILLTNFEKLNLAWEIATRPDNLSAEQERVLWDTLKKNVRMLDETGFLEQESRVLSAMYEWYDGSGRPSSLQGDNIPFLARCLAVLAAYSLLREGGPHTLPHVPDEAMSHLEEERGTHFDPAILDAMQIVLKNYAQETPQAKGERLLLVEDHPPVRSIMTRRLVAAGYDVCAVATAAEARAAISEGSWYAALVDLMLPQESGFSLFEDMNALKERAGTPWAVVSARFDRATIEAVREAGAFGYVVKPIRFESLLRSLRTCRESLGFELIAK